MFSDYDYPIDIPTWKKGDWSITSFDKLENFKIGFVRLSDIAFDQRSKENGFANLA